VEEGERHEEKRRQEQEERWKEEENKHKEEQEGYNTKLDNFCGELKELNKHIACLGGKLENSTRISNLVEVFEGGEGRNVENAEGKDETDNTLDDISTKGHKQYPDREKVEEGGAVTGEKTDKKETEEAGESSDQDEGVGQTQDEDLVEWKENGEDPESHSDYESEWQEIEDVIQAVGDMKSVNSDMTDEEDLDSYGFKNDGTEKDAESVGSDYLLGSEDGRKVRYSFNLLNVI